ncbi:tail length tape measure protein [Pseudoalteromonas phage vB_PspS-H40/1]|uniref:tail length tape measure protein n=1 Tax=Pseudoalteromonas phage vB_PspS-H40/1 TaxID=1856120 RepID=UPI0007DD63DF|nr:tail length tape measure protein [Pseudoalteromonas phage vB_PspS-H40/1]ANI22088.1 putative tail length tape-measure protein [Pseudoalteromonas phage vB_PspS-H40/1]
MAENLGAIRYDIEVETASMLKAEAVVDKSTTNVANDFKKIDSAAKNTSTQMTKAAAGVKKGVQANLGQAGIQVQQFVGQLQGGQSAMVALAQQSADLGIVLGAPLIGVFVSLAAVLAGTLAPAIFGSVSNIEKLQKAIENTKAIMTVGASGVAEYTEEIKRLNTASESLAKIKIALAMTENAEALKASKKEASALRAEIIGFQEDATDAAKRLTGLTSSTNDILSLTGAMNDFNAATSDDKKLKALDTAEKALLNMRKNGVFPTKELAEYAAEFFTFSDATRQAIANNKALSVSMDDIASSTKDAESQFKSIKEALRSQIIELNSGEEAALRYSLLLDGLNSDQIDQIITLTRKKKALEDEAEAVKLAQKANEDYKESIKSVNDELDAFFDKESSDSTKKEDRRKATLTTQVQSIGLTPIEQIQAQYEAEKALLEQAEADKIEIVGTYAERYKQIEAEKQEAIKGLQGETNSFLEDAFGNLDTQITGTLASVVTGAKDGKDALKSLADTILTQLIGAIIKQGIASVFATETSAKAQTVANTEILATAVPAAAATSLASFGANSGPALAGIAAVNAAAMLIPSLAGGRQYGGPVSKGMYRVNETGTPEVYSQGGKDYLMNTKNANITPLDKAGGGQMSVVINNNAAGVDVSANQVDARTIEISVNKAMQEFANQVRTGQGDAIRSLTSNTNVTRRG